MRANCMYCRNNSLLQISSAELLVWIVQLLHLTLLRCTCCMMKPRSTLLECFGLLNIKILLSVESIQDDDCIVQCLGYV